MWSQRVGRTGAIHQSNKAPLASFIAESYQHLTVIGTLSVGGRGIDLLSKWPPNHSFVLSLVFIQQTIIRYLLFVGTGVRR